MASGGYRPNKSGKSEPKRRSNWQQSVSSDRDDAQSLNSLHSDMRINNWDLSDLCPSNLGGDSKRRKKSKGNPEREREQSLSVDSPPHDKKHYTSLSYSNTKRVPSALTSQRVALENLKQHMTFSDLDDQVSTDGERNNERQILQSRRRFQNASFNRADSEEEVRGTRDRHINRNNNMDYSSREQGPDSNEIVAHLMQIRDFTKQARSMLESMEKLGDRKKAEDIEKVRRLIINLQEQEQGYRGLLQNTLTHSGDGGNEATGGDGAKLETKYDSDDDTSVDLDVQTEESETTENSQDSRPRIESKLGIGTDDDDEEDGRKDQYRLSLSGSKGNSSKKANSIKPTGMENTKEKGHFIHAAVPVQEKDESARGASTAKESDIPLPQEEELLQILKLKQQQLQALMNRQEELNLKRRKTEKKLLEAQTRDNKARAALATVSAGRQIVEESLVVHQAIAREAELEAASWEMNGDEEDSGTVGQNRQLKSNIVGYPESDDEDNSKVCEVETLPNELQELKWQLNYLRNEFTQASEAPKNVGSEARPQTEGREQLQNKLMDLQNKKSRIDLLLQELQKLHSQPLEHLRNNGTSSSQPSTAVANIPAPRPQQPISKAVLSRSSSNTGYPTNQQTRMSEMSTADNSSLDNAISSFAHLTRKTTSEQASGEAMPGVVQEMREKLKHLKEVRGQLDQLKSLVQFYQGQRDELEAAGGTMNPPPAGFKESSLHALTNAEERGSHSAQQQQSQLQSVQEMLRLHAQQVQQHQGKDAGTNASSSSHMVQLPNLAGTDQGVELSDEDNASVSHTDSQWSHLGPWDDDPDIQEKVRKLRAAKEKLRQLQDLVSFVQQSPDVAGTAPENLGDLAASLEGEAVSHATQTDDLNVSTSEGELPSETRRISTKDDLNGIESQRGELLRLRKERSMLLEIQNQLKNIHNQQSVPHGEVHERAEPTNSEVGKPELEQMTSSTVVTFASNDELYSKMRRQRILREELRSKKKELEAIMKKDRNKRQYSRNQDNQSDTVSLNTDTFGIPASIDATMATWGGSTVDNLENITEDGQERDDHVDGDEDDDDDDGYPSDGIVQVEEEEEENDSDDGTYTIERDARQRKNTRKVANADLGARPKTSRGRQTYPQPTYKDSKKSSRRQNSNRIFQVQSNVRSRSEDRLQPSEQRQEEKSLRDQNYDWFRSVEDKLTGLSSSVETLLRKSESEGRQLSVALNQDSALQSGRLMSPMQEQMLQLQNQSMMLSFGQLVQSMTHQQGDIQQLQQQMQQLQLQMQEISQEHSFHMGPIAGVGHSPLLHSAMSNPVLQTAAVGTHTLTFNHQQMASPFGQSNLRSATPSGLFENMSSNSPGLRNLHSNSLGHSPGNLLLSVDRRTDGASGLGTNLTVNTASNVSLPQQSSRFAYNSTEQTTSNLHQQASQSNSSVSTFSKDISGSQFSNTHEPNTLVADKTFRDINRISGSSSQHQQNLTSRHPFLASQVVGSEGLDHDNSVQRVNSYLIDKKNKIRKQVTKVKKSESDPNTGVRVPTSQTENFPGQDNIGNSNNYYWHRETAHNYRSVPGSDGFDEDTGRLTNVNRGLSHSSLQAIRDRHSKLKREQQSQAKTSTASAESNTFFDTLRDAIYAEIAAVISQNENRPHYLLELFRDMRHIDSDLLRQRTLFSLQELLRSNLKDSSAVSPTTPNTAGTTNSEQTPSESVTSEDDEDQKVTRLQEEIAAAERSRLTRNGRFGSFPFDYLPPNNQSYLSTPSNGGEESPFFQDALGETMIDFDSFKKRGEEKQQLTQGDLSKQKVHNQTVDKKKGYKLEHYSSLASEHLLNDLKDSRGRRKLKGASGGEVDHRSQDSQLSEALSSSAMDQCSESSISDMPYARIDIKQLDHQIKDIMMETIPMVKKHMDDICSSQLLEHIRHLVLSLTDQMSNQEFARFFQHQLASILEDTLLKYEGRKMRDCGEDLLVEISDVLFNELAFFRLMQDLDDPSVSRKTRSAEWTSTVSKDENSSEYAGSSTTSDGFEEDNNRDADNKTRGDGADKSQDNNGVRRDLGISESEQEELGRDRDDEMASEMGMRDGEEKDDDESEHPYKIELAPSETKPFTRIGSDEDDDEGDEELSVDDPSETAVSRDSLLEINDQAQNLIPLSTRPETEGSHGDGAEKQDQEKPVSPRKTGQSTAAKSQAEGEATAVPSPNNTSTIVTETPQINGTVNGLNNNGSDEDEDDEVTIEDLPELLTVTSPPPIADNKTPELGWKQK